MVMIFENQKALNFLLDMGFVYTFRKKQRKKIGKDWINDGRGRKKISDVKVRFIKPIKTAWDLEHYVFASGFDNLTEWLNAISDMHGERVYNALLESSELTGYLYHVSLRG